MWSQPRKKEKDRWVSVEQLKAAVRLDPELAKPRIDLGISFYDVGETQAAMEELKVALSLKPPRDQLWLRKRAEELLKELTRE